MATELKRAEPVRLPNPSAQPFVSALKTARFFAVVFFWVTMLALLAQLTAFVLADFVELYDGADLEAVRQYVYPMPEEGVGWLMGLVEGRAAAADAPAAPAEPDEGEAGAAPAPGEGKGGTIEAPSEAAGEAPAPAAPSVPMSATAKARLSARIFGPTRVLGLLAAALLWVTMFLYLQVALLGRLAGIRQMTRAFFVQLLFLATALPWHQVFVDFELGSFFPFVELLSARAALGAAEPAAADLAFFYGRFFVLPLVSLGLLVVAGVQFHRGYNESVLANE